MHDQNNGKHLPSGEGYRFYDLFNALMQAREEMGIGFYSPFQQGSKLYIDLTLPDPKGETPLIVRVHKSGMSLICFELFNVKHEPVIHPFAEGDRTAKAMEILEARCTALGLPLP